MPQGRLRVAVSMQRKSITRRYLGCACRSDHPGCRTDGWEKRLGAERMDGKNAEECLREAEECDRLVDLANTHGARTLLMVAAFQWRKLAEKAAERQKRSWPLVREAIRPN
jgi:hypothetical protein